MCKLCDTMPPTKVGGIKLLRRCAFDKDGNFTELFTQDCQTMSELLKIALNYGKVNTIQMALTGQTRIITLFYPGDPDICIPGWIMITYDLNDPCPIFYRVRFIFRASDMPITLAIAESCIDYYNKI